MAHGDVMGNSAEARDQREAGQRDAADNLSGMQRVTQKQNRSMPERDFHAGRGGLALLALPEQGRGVLQ